MQNSYWLVGCHFGTMTWLLKIPSKDRGKKGTKAKFKTLKVRMRAGETLAFGAGSGTQMRHSLSGQRGRVVYSVVDVVMVWSRAVKTGDMS